MEGFEPRALKFSTEALPLRTRQSVPCVLLSYIRLHFGKKNFTAELEQLRSLGKVENKHEKSL